MLYEIRSGYITKEIFTVLFLPFIFYGKSVTNSLNSVLDVHRDNFYLNYWSV